MLASASDAIIIGFNVRPARRRPPRRRAEGVDIRTYSVIYKITEDLRDAMEGMLEPIEVEETLGEAEVLRGLQGFARRHHRRLPRHRRPRHPRRRGPPDPRRHRRLDRPDRLAAPLQGRRPARSTEGQECGIVLEGYAGRQGRRHPRVLRDQAGRADARVADRARSVTDGTASPLGACSAEPHRCHPQRAPPDASSTPAEVPASAPSSSLTSQSAEGEAQGGHSLKALLRQRFGASVAEIAGHDTWQRTTLLCALVGGAEVEHPGGELARFVEARCPGRLLSSNATCRASRTSAAERRYGGRRCNVSATSPSL